MDIRRTSDIAKEQDSGEFIIRDRLPHIWQLALLFFVSFSVLFLVATNAEFFGGSISVAIAIFAIIGPLCWFTIYFNQRNRDMVLAAEFQNALFSAAVRLKSKFCMIVKKDGTVFYYDRGFQKIFPETANRGVLMLEKIFSTKHITTLEAKKLDAALENNKPETIIIQVPDEDGKPSRVVISIDPISRPSGFFILRGRDYVVKQYDRTSAQENLNSNRAVFLNDERSSETLGHLLQMLPIGLYATDPEGRVLFANYPLESWLGYEQGEILAREMSLYDLIPQNNTPTAEGIFLRDCSGPVVFITKERKQVTLHMTQEITRAENGASIGTVAIIKPADTHKEPAQPSAEPVSPLTRNSSTPTF